MLTRNGVFSKCVSENVCSFQIYAAVNGFIRSFQLHVDTIDILLIRQNIKFWNKCFTIFITVLLLHSISLPQLRWIMRVRCLQLLHRSICCGNTSSDILSTQTSKLGFYDWSVLFKEITLNSVLIYAFFMLQYRVLGYLIILHFFLKIEFFSWFFLFGI